MDLIQRSPRTERLRLYDAIKGFQAELSPADASKFIALQSGSAPKASDVFRLTEEVNRDGHKVHKTWRQYGGRLQKLLDQILVFTKVGDILVGGSQNMIACGVWAAVRLSIQIATGYLGFFDKVSNLWMRIGRSSEVQEELVQLFPQCSELQDWMCEYLVATINFCQRIVAFAKRPLISQITSTFSITFEKEFSEFEHQLTHLAKLMNQKVKVLTTQMTLDSSSAIAKTSKLLALGSLAARERDYEYRRAKLLNKLCPFQDRLDRRQRHERKKGPVKWIFENPDYISWASGSGVISVLALSGKIGSGKSVTAANIISSLQASSAMSDGIAVAGFFCRASDPRTIQPDTIMGSIAYQFVRSLGREAKRAIDGYLPSRNTLGDVIPLTFKALPTSHRYFLIIDGLDECDMHDVDDVVQTVHTLRQCVGGQQVFFLFSCRTDSPIISGIQTTFHRPHIQLSLSNPRHDKELENYIDSQIETRRHMRKLSPKLEAAVRMALIAGAQGMFLWATLQLDMIYPYDHTYHTLTDSDLTILLERLPKGLEAAFDKILQNISDQQRAKKVFQVVAGSERPLTTDELAVATNIQPGNINWDQSTFPLNPTALMWTCGGGLLEVMEEDDTVHFIHHSALRHLLLDGNKPPGPGMKRDTTTSLYKFTLQEATTIVAAMCVTYLSYSMHDSRLMKRVKMPDDRNIVETVADCVTRNQASMSDILISRVLDRRKSSPVSKSSATIFNMVNELAREKYEADHDRAVKLFLDYASRHWLDHTKHFISPSDLEPDGLSTAHAVVPEVVYQLFSSLVRSNLPHLRRPWPQETDSARIGWALRSGHLALCCVVLHIGFGHGPHTNLSTAGEEHAKPILEEIQEAINTSPDAVKILAKEPGGVIALLIYFRTLDRYPVKLITTTISTLVEHGFDPNSPLATADGTIWSPLCLALREIAGQPAGEISPTIQMILDVLLSLQASPIGEPRNTNGGPRPVFMALDLSLGTIACRMLELVPSTDGDFEDEHGRTLLGMVVCHSTSLAQGHGELHCRQLLEAGANPNKPTSTTRVSWEPYILLHRPRVNPNRKSDEQLVPEMDKVPLLIVAARHGHYNIFRLLVECGASLDMPFRGEPIWKYLDGIIRKSVYDMNYQEVTRSKSSKSLLGAYWKSLISQRERAEALDSGT